jgi:hypothetical protein
MSIKLDLKRMYTDYGSEITILRTSATEYIDIKLNAQATKPFIREHFRECQFPYDSAARPADIVNVEGPDEKLMIMNVTPDIFQGEVVKNSCVAYKCNVSGEITRQSGERNANSYHWEESWVSVKTTAYGLLTQGLYGTDLEQNLDIGQIEVQDMALYIPESYGARQLDRYSPTSGEYYKIESIEKTRFPNIIVCQISEDTR